MRLGVSYDQARQIFTLDDRFTPEELFDNALREGYRVTAYLGSAKTVRGNFSIGQRWKQGNPDRSLAYNANVYHSNVFGWNMLVGGDYSGFDGDTSSGFRAGLRVQKYFRSGHDVELTIGTSGTERRCRRLGQVAGDFQRRVGSARAWRRDSGRELGRIGPRRIPQPWRGPATPDNGGSESLLAAT